MPITSDTPNSGSGKGVATLTIAHTVSNNFDRILLARIAMFDNTGQTVTGITFNGVSLNRHAFVTAAPTRAELWYLVAPSVGTFNLVITISAGVNIVADCNSDYGVDQLTPIGNAFTATASSAAPGVNVTLSEPDITVDRVLDVLAAMEIGAGTLTATVALGQTQVTNLKTVGAPNGQNILLGTSRRFAAANPQTMAWTLSAVTSWAQIGSYLRPSRARMQFNAKGSASASFNPKTFDYVYEQRLRDLEARVARHDYRLRD